MLSGLIKAGANAFRVNMSHSTPEELADRVRVVRRLAAEAGATIAVIADLAGPKVRLGEVAGGSVDLARGATFRLVRDTTVGDATRASTNHPALVDEVPEGATILIDDGVVQLKVDSKTAGELVCTVAIGGLIGSRKGVAVPGASLGFEPVTNKDRNDLTAALDAGVDWVAMSFVTRGADIGALRGLMGDRLVPIIAKIETSQAVAAIDEIVDAADGIMIARGDLGVELPSAEVPVLQKEIVAKTISAGKPVVTATQMLESMIGNPTPTRAEASDVANAVFDGSDALMLSGETAAGDYPVESVRMMSDIILKAEAAPWFAARQAPARQERMSVTDAISAATCELARDLDAAAIVTSTESGHTARQIARHRTAVAIVAVSPNEAVVRQLVLSRGVVPLNVGASIHIDDMLDRAAQATVDAGLAAAGDTLVITAGVLVNRPGTTNMIKVHRL